MSDRQPNDDEAFAEHVARPLRAAEHANAGFEDSLIAAIRADRPLRRIIPRRASVLSGAWWSAPAVVRLSPIVTVALAAGIAAIAVLTAQTLRHSSSPPSANASSPVVATGPIHDTVTFVRFVFVGKARSVALVGDFNRWGGQPTVLDRTTGGAWTASVPLSNGRHEYAFIVDGEQWVADPLAPSSSDDFDTKSSIIMVGT
jgi:hypothetical protein